jgi:RNA polymerase sigma-70 factor (ECF subfamily)
MSLFARAIDVPLGPEARYEQTESISLAFVTPFNAGRPHDSSF